MANVGSTQLHAGFICVVYMWLLALHIQDQTRSLCFSIFANLGVYKRSLTHLMRRYAIFPNYAQLSLITSMTQASFTGPPFFIDSHDYLFLSSLISSFVVCTGATGFYDNKITAKYSRLLIPVWRCHNVSWDNIQHVSSLKTSVMQILPLIQMLWYCGVYFLIQC